jgi:L-amino acid N-acyltransferase YncA
MSSLAAQLSIRSAFAGDIESIRRIYNEGIEDRIATLDSDPKDAEEIAAWWAAHDERYAVLIADEAGAVVGWASLNRFSHRCAHAAIADLSVYIARSHRGRGIGYALLTEIEKCARAGGFHKIVLHASDVNEHGKRLYEKCGYRVVGIFEEHGRLDGRYMDVIAMEKLLR